MARLSWLILAVLLLAMPDPTRSVVADMYQDGSNAKIPEAQMNLGLAAAGNPKDFDPLCDGRTTEAEVVNGTAHDCSAAINSAALVVINGKTANVQLQPGLYYLTNTVSLLTGQTLIGAGRARTFIRIRDTFNPAATAVFTIAGSNANFGEFGGIRDLTISFSQPFTQASRANFQLLGTCTSQTNGTGCKYPPAVLLASGRSNFNRMQLEKAWDGIVSAGTGSTVQINDMMMSAFNVGLFIDGAKDSSYIERFHFWTFGFQASQPIYGVFEDGNTDCMRIGDTDGFDTVNVFCHAANIRFVESVAYPGDAAGSVHMSNVFLDHGGRFIVEATNNLEVVNMGQSGTSNLAVPPNCSLTINTANRPGDRVMITNYWIQNSTNTNVCVYKGALHLEHARIANYTDKPTVLVDGGLLYMRSVHWGTSGSVVRTAPVIKQVSGSMSLSGHSMTGPSVGGGGVAIETTTDSSTLTDINLGGYGISFGCGPTTAGWCFTGTPQGFYDLPDYPFTMTATPFFTGTTDFVPVNAGTASQWWLRGNKVEFWLRQAFDTNAHTTGTDLRMATSLPTSMANLGSSRTCFLQIYDKVSGWTVPPRCGIVNNAGNTASDFNFSFPVAGGTGTNVARANIPPSTAAFLFAISGWYPIR